MEQEDVNEEEAIEFANSINAKFRLTSAKKDPKGFSVVLEELLKDYINKKDKKEEKNITLEKKEKKRKKRC